MHDPSWWSFGKVVAYLGENGPFIHVDYDVILWSALPQRILEADVFCQNLEEFVVGESKYYMLHLIEDKLEYAGGWLPAAWLWLRNKRGAQLTASCCGIFGGKNIDFIHYYASQVRQILDHEKNRAIFSNLKHKTRHMVLLEQFTLNACYEFWNRQESRYDKLDFESLFDSEIEAYRRASRIGYTHLIASAKTNPNVVNALDARVKDEYSILYDRLATRLLRIRKILAF
ncbi:MAG: hypothetical protein QY310_06520 [Candidatus Jettenia sp. CY-1]|nr:MAG: hypothetical protein QY310_06520 [Candidatus Jettenia sp. CY-1]